MSSRIVGQKWKLFNIIAFLIPVTIIILISGCHRNLSKANLDEKDPSLKLSESSLTDIDGNTYPVLLIGEQLWMGSNLRVSHYTDGNPIQASSGQSSLEESKSGAYVWYDNDESHNETYGKLYNFNAVQEGNLCPEGWHVPTGGDWQQLLKNADEDMMKSAFSNQPGGFFNPQEIPPFSDLDKAGFWWTTAFVGRNTIAIYSLRSDELNMQRSSVSERNFLAVRCIKTRTTIN